jgi:hypothetical protein
MLDDLKPAVKVNTPSNFRPGIEFDGSEGIATTPGYAAEPENFDEFLLSAGLNPEEIEVIAPIKTSRWQQREDGPWLTSYRFTFRRKGQTLDLPKLFADVKKTHIKLKRPAPQQKALIVAPADFQIGKTGSRGGTKELIERVLTSYDRAEALMKQNKYERIWILDLGDLIESISSTADQQQLATNDIGVTDQVSLGIDLMWELIKRASKYAPVTYGSIASNHCQVRSNRQAVGRPGVDDWGIMVLKQLRRLATETGLDTEFLIPQPEDEGFAFQYGIHTIGAVHGHQVSRPDGIPKWWASQQFGAQWAESVSLMLTGHFHHTRIEELGQYRVNGEVIGSKYWVQMPTSDAGSDWYRRRAGVDSATGIGAIELSPEQPYLGAMIRL